MTTDIFRERTCFRVLACLLTAIVFAFAGYAAWISRVQKIAINKTFYFLVSTSNRIEASSHFVSWSGGAGFLLKQENDAYVAFSVYLNKEDSEAVQATLTNRKTSIVTFYIDKLYLKTRKQKKSAEEITGAFRSFYGCLTMLNGEIIRFSKSATQESSRRTLEVLQRQFQFLSQEYKKIFPQFSKTCKSGEKSLENVIQGTVFLKDLRYLLCELCVSYLELASIFSL